MIDLIWSILNFAILIYFFYFIFSLIMNWSATLKKRGSVLGFIVVALVLVSFSKSAINDEFGNRTISTRDIKAEKVDFSMINGLTAFIVYDPFTGEVDKEESDSMLHGLMLGRKWEHLSANRRGNDLYFSGAQQYSLITIPVYKQTHRFEIEDFFLD